MIDKAYKEGAEEQEERGQQRGEQARAIASDGEGEEIRGRG